MSVTGWTAGIIDGEGYIGIEAKRGMVRVDNTDLRIIEKLEQGWHGSAFEYKRPDRPRSKRIWRWAVTGRSAALFLEAIEPFLVSKQERAREVIDFYKNR